MKLELKIVDLLNRNKEKEFTINEVAKSLDQYYSFVHRIIERLAEDNIIIKKKIGKSYVCSLNMDNEKTTSLLYLAEIERKEAFYQKNRELKLILEEFIDLIKKEAYSVILFGSYAKGRAVKDSDLDILIIVKNKISIDKIIRELYAKYGKEINVIMLTPEEFAQQRDKEFVKEIIRNHYILYGTEIFTKEIVK